MLVQRKCFLLCLLALALWSTPLFAAKLIQVKGAVEVQRNGKGKWLRAKENTSLHAGDRVRTKRGGSCLIAFGTIASVKLRPFSNFALTKEQIKGDQANISTSLLIGKTFHKIKRALSSGSSYQVQTPTAIAGVKSTSFSVEVLPGGETIVSTFEAKVPLELTAQGTTVQVPAGQKSTVLPGATPAPAQPLSSEEEQEFEATEEELGEATPQNPPSGETTEEETVTVAVNVPAETSQEKLQVTGTTTPSATVSVGGEVVTADTSGNFSVTVTLKEGENTLTFAVKTPSGKEVTVTKTVVYTKAEEDTIPPTLVVTSPPPNSIFNKSNVVLTCKTEPGATVTVNGVKATVNADGGCTASLSLFEGKNLLTIEAKDAAENKTSTTLPLTLDTLPPFLTVQNPRDKFNTCTPVVQVIGITEASARLRIQGQNVKLDSSGGFQYPLSLKSGSNQIKIEAEDAAGNLTQQMLSGEYLATTSFLNVTQPQNNERPKTSSILVIGFTNPGSTVRINQRVVFLDPGGKFEQKVSLNPNAKTRIVVESETKCGDLLKVVRTVLPEIPPVPPGP